ncbi:hypothetical protein [Alloactinosynnema sp. L-07]|uniref:nucleotide exchange factor GrpE n=1 Tax=Alloactinosynnema sp. L-07 TaxID=1653480 RepID=UPI00065EF69F|nr:nucleotide exchange factor GrpE [Alloactinosynnema sp. L-07]CRK59396.1 hypothetical protein [Alloactinosynnema sp. L-07]
MEIVTDADTATATADAVPAPPDPLQRRLDQIGGLLEEVVDDNTAVVATMNDLAQAQRALSADVGREITALRADLVGGLVHRTLKDLCVELISPLAAMDKMVADGTALDPTAVASHVRSLALTLRGVLSRMGAEPIAVDVGATAFDPYQHRCVGVVEPDDSPFPDAAPRTVVRVVEDGYLLDRKILVPATVEIQSGRADLTPDQAE